VDYARIRLERPRSATTRDAKMGGLLEAAVPANAVLNISFLLFISRVNAPKREILPAEVLVAAAAAVSVIEPLTTVTFVTISGPSVAGEPLAVTMKVWMGVVCGAVRVEFVNFPVMVALLTSPLIAAVPVTAAVMVRVEFLGTERVG